MKQIFKSSIITLSLSLFAFGIMSTSIVHAATLNLPGSCSSISSCVSSMSSGDTLLIADGTYSDSISGVKANVIIQAANDGKVKFTGSFNPGNTGFTMQGIIVKSSDQKDLGSGNTYRRMSFIGGPSCGNVVNSVVGSNTKIYDSAFYGLGGRYLLLAYQQSGGIVAQNVIFRPDGGWGNGSSCNEWEPHAAYNMYDTEGFTITGAIVVDAISSASGESENIGGQVINTHQSHGNVGTISQSAITTSGNYGRFSSDGQGLHNVTISDSIARGNSIDWGMTRNCSGTTTATRFDTDKQVSAWKGSINRTAGANFTLNTAFLNDPRWKQEMCTDAGVTRGFCAGSALLGEYIATNLGISAPTPDTTSPTSPTNLAANAISSSSITVTWNPATDNVGVTGYLVERCQGSGCSNFAQVGTPTASPFVDTDLTPNTVYNYHVRATDAAGNLSGWSNVVGATTQAPDTTLPSVPSSLTATVVSSSNITLAWTSSTDNIAVTGYKLERCAGASCSNFVEIATPSSNSQSDTGLSSQTLYRYRVRATDAANNTSSYSSIAEGATPQVPPTPTFVAEYETAWNSATSPKTTSNFSVQTGDVLVAYAVNEDAGNTLTTPPAGTLTGTWTLRQSATTASYTGLRLWSMNVASNQSNVNVSFANGGNNFGGNVLHFRNASSVGITAQANSNTGNPTLTLNGISENSSIVMVNGDWSARTGARTYNTTSAGAFTETSAYADGTSYGLEAGYYANAGASGNKNVSLTAPTGMTWALAALEVKGNPTAQPISCNTVTTANFSDAGYNSYGAPFDAFQTSTNLMDAKCTSADTHTINLTTGITGDTTRIVYTKGYWYDAVTTAWRQYTGTCTGALNGEWCQGSVSATITDANVSTANAANPTYSPRKTKP